jgi:signal transduction histidine kinase
VAILYLENNLTTQAFTAERLVALELLGAQAAISLENALLLAKEQKAARRPRRRASWPRRPERRLTFLAHELRSPLASVVLRLGALIMAAEHAESVPSDTPDARAERAQAPHRPADRPHRQPAWICRACSAAAVAGARADRSGGGDPGRGRPPGRAGQLAAAR